MTPTDIANLARHDIGANTIETLEAEPVDRALYNQALAEILREHDWNFATTGPVELAQLDPQPTSKPGSFSTAYELPAAYVRRVELASGGRGLEAYEFAIIGRTVWTSFSTLALTYVHNAPNASTFPADFTTALAKLLASKLARTLLKDAKLTATLKSEYHGESLPAAKKNDTQENPGGMLPHHQHPYASSPLVATRGSRYGNPARAVDPPTA